LCRTELIEVGVGIIGIFNADQADKADLHGYEQKTPIRGDPL
jgi:hypothetical protein